MERAVVASSLLQPPTFERTFVKADGDDVVVYGQHCLRRRRQRERDDELTARATFTSD